MAQGKRPLTEAQKAALARGQAKRKANLAARRASHGRQAASSQVASLPSLARDALNPANSPASEAAAADVGDSSTASSLSSSRSKPSTKLTQAEQDALMFSFVMESDEDKDAAAPSEAKKSSVGDKLAGLLTNSGPKPTGNQQEDDAQQAAAQWQDLGAVAFIFIAGQIFGADLAPSDKQAQAMSAPLCRILMRHVAPLRNASADAYDIAAFAGATLIYYQSISPELARRRAERKVTHAPAKAPEQQASAGGADTITQRGNVRILHPDDTPGRRRYDGEPPENRGADVRENEQQPHRGDAGAAIVSEIVGVEL